MIPAVRFFGHHQGEACYWFHRTFYGLDWINDRDDAWLLIQADREIEAIESRLGRKLSTEERLSFCDGFIHTLSNRRDQERMLNDDTWYR